MTSAISPLRAKPTRRGSLTSRAHRLAPYLFSAPAIVLYVIFTVIPVFYTIWLSLRAYRIQGGALGRKQDVFVGFENYLAVLADTNYVDGFVRIAIYGVIAIPVTLGLALLFALLLDVPAVRAKRFSRTAIFVPYAVPGVVAALLWGFMYLPSTSPFSFISKSFGGGTLPFLEYPGIYGSLANITVWGAVGFNMIIIYTSLRGIPTEIYESARLDGATETQIALRIKVPLVAPALVLTGFFSVIGTIQLYSEPTTIKAMSGTISNTWVPLMNIYRDAFATDNLPQAAAASTLLAIGTVAASALVLSIVNRRRAGAQS